MKNINPNQELGSYMLIRYQNQTSRYIVLTNNHCMVLKFSETFCVMFFFLLFFVILFMSWWCLSTCENHHIFFFLFVDFGTVGKLRPVVFYVPLGRSNLGFVLLVFVTEVSISLGNFSVEVIKFICKDTKFGPLPPTSVTLCANSFICSSKSPWRCTNNAS